MECITTYYRDGVEVTHEEWSRLLKKDLEIENEERTWDIKGAVYTDIGNGRDIDLNGHSYTNRTQTVYDSAKELFDDFMFEGIHDLILDVLQELPEEDLFKIMSKLKHVTLKDGKLILEDEKDW